MKKIIIILGCLVVAAVTYKYLYADAQEEDVDMSNNVAIIIASNGFQEHEYAATCNALKNAGYLVTTVSDGQTSARGNAGSVVSVDCTVANLQPSQYAGIFMIGGPGTLDCLDNVQSYKLLNEVFTLQKPYGAICIAPRILSHAQVLRGKNATGWDGDGLLSQDFEMNEVIYVKQPVVVDGRIVTADGPDAADDFGAAIVTLLQGK